MYLEYLLSQWKSVRAGLVETINKFRDDELEYKPFTDSRSVRQLMLHIPQEENGEFNYGVVQTLSEFPAEYNSHEYVTIASIQTLLESVHVPTIKYLESRVDADLSRVITTPWGANYLLIEMLEHLIEHEIHHRAELSLILGMLGRQGLDA
jgi:uncharacterized damage-inducible protein DinB